MKNKSLLATLILITTLVVFSLVFEKTDNQVPLAAKKVVKVGILQLVTHEALDQIEQGIEDELAKSPNKNQKIEIHLMNAEADQSKLQTMSKQLVSSGNDIVVGIATPAAQGLATASKDIPVVMSAITDPVGAKLVKNLKKPEANVTGLSNQVPVAQTVKLIKDISPQTKTVGVLYASSEDNSISQVKAFKQEAAKEGITVLSYAVPSTNEVPSTMAIMTSKVDAIFIPQDNTIASAFSAVISAANAAKKPVYSSVDTMVKDGSIASVSQNQYDLGVQTAKQIKALLKGKKVSQVPVKIVDTGKPILNRKAAAELGIKIPDEVLKRSQIIVKE
ncbi:peptide ABC transporter substrate-binding protein [Streptococcus iniae]|uniref:tryptophan ABC transporter substrate-binding protein n=1 Tax=Streptococcus iniae TaxID=1346 RepID=UPI0008D9FE73|nr:tryptophan ABC transporter substrate-binding protein [Streptococcus iniae]OHX27508.1 peptide ABC transporter substrate-binding protein [Streptococcus iniae]RLV28102.1 peptide ABC transporter substrate-binding protein [Streptococcus iniae]